MSNLWYKLDLYFYLIATTIEEYCQFYISGIWNAGNTAILMFSRPVKKYNVPDIPEYLINVGQ